MLNKQSNKKTCFGLASKVSTKNQPQPCPSGVCPQCVQTPPEMWGPGHGSQGHTQAPSSRAPPSKLSDPWSFPQAYSAISGCDLSAQGLAKRHFTEPRGRAGGKGVRPRPPSQSFASRDRPCLLRPWPGSSPLSAASGQEGGVCGSGPCFYLLDQNNCH